MHANNLLLPIIALLALVGLLAVTIWYGRPAQSARTASRSTGQDTTVWLLISLLLIAAFGFGALLTYVLLRFAG